MNEVASRKIPRLCGVVSVSIIEGVVEGNVYAVEVCYCHMEGYVTEWEFLCTFEWVEEGLRVHLTVLSDFTAFKLEEVDNCICKFFLGECCYACFMKSI